MTNNAYEGLDAPATKKLEETAAALSGFKNSNEPFNISGYLCSDGSMCDYNGLRYLETGGYIRLVMDSCEWLTNLISTASLPSDVSMEAADEQLTSWNKTLTKEGHGRAYKEADYHDDSGSFSMFNTNPGVLIIKNLELIGSMQHHNKSEKPSPKSDKAKAKAWIRYNSPLNRYVGQLNLASDKFDSLYPFELSAESV